MSRTNGKVVDSASLLKSIEVLGKKVALLENINKKDESHVATSGNNNESEFEKWSRNFALDPSFRAKFLLALSTSEREWYESVKKCMGSADSLTPEMVTFLKQNATALTNKRVSVKAGETRPPVGEEGKALEKRKKAILGFIMVGSLIS